MMHRIDDDLCFTPIISDPVGSISVFVPARKLNFGNFPRTEDKMEPGDGRSADHGY
jgi:hypothetical protein